MKDNLKLLLAKDLTKLGDYILKHDLDSYMIIVNIDNQNYFYVWNFNESPNLLIANNELVTMELKIKIVKAITEMLDKQETIKERNNKLN